MPFVAGNLVRLGAVRLEAAGNLDLVHAIEGHGDGRRLVQGLHLDAVRLQAGDHLGPLHRYHVLLRPPGHQVRFGVAGNRHRQLLGLVAPDDGLGAGDRRLLERVITHDERNGLVLARLPGEDHLLLRLQALAILVDGLLQRGGLFADHLEHRLEHHVVAQHLGFVRMQRVLLDEDRRHVANVAVLVGKTRVIAAIRVVALGRVLAVVHADALVHHMAKAFQLLVHRWAHRLVHPLAAGRRPAVAVVAVRAVIGIHGAVGGVDVGEEAQVVVAEHPGDVADFRAVQLGEVAVEVVVQAVDPPAGLVRAVLVDPSVGTLAQVAVDVDGGDEQDVDLLQQAGERLVAGGHVTQQHEHRVLAVGLAGVDFRFDEDRRLARLVQRRRRLVGLRGSHREHHRVAFGAFLRQVAERDFAAGRGRQLLHPGTGLFVVGGLAEAAGLGEGYQRVIGLGDELRAGQLLLEHRRQDALLGRRRVTAVVDVGRRPGQFGEGRQATAEQHGSEQRARNGMAHGSPPFRLILGMECVLR
ncbi:hypothetical protein D3C78_537780 [compost metagenome]